MTISTLVVLAASAIFGYCYFKKRNLVDLGLCLFALSFALGIWL